MGFVALTLGFPALGAYIGRDLSGGIWPVAGLVIFLLFLQLFGGNND